MPATVTATTGAGTETGAGAGAATTTMQSAGRQHLAQLSFSLSRSRSDCGVCGSNSISSLCAAALSHHLPYPALPRPSSYNEQSIRTTPARSLVKFVDLHDS